MAGTRGLVQTSGAHLLNGTLLRLQLLLLRSLQLRGCVKLFLKPRSRLLGLWKVGRVISPQRVTLLRRRIASLAQVARMAARCKIVKY